MKRKDFGSVFFIIVCMNLNLREFWQIFLKNYLWNSLDQISGWLTQFLFRKVSFISDFSRSLI
jgi:hypothetical protein